MITVVDYGVGNVGAILNMLDYLGFEAEPSGEADRIAAADKLILPGVGAFDKAMLTLREHGLIAALDAAILERHVPALGVCLGMQLLARCSEEGQEMGLGYIDAQVERIKIPASSNLKVPHIGWMEVEPTGRGRLFDSIQPAERYYFDHSYHVVCVNPSVVSATIQYGSELCCAIEEGNIFGVQFHPEKSHRFGMRLLSIFGQLT